jgi:hypothetical protein
MSSVCTKSVPVAAALAITLCSAAEAQSEQSSPALHWSRAAGAGECVDPRTLAHLVESYTGPVLVAPAQADVSIEGQIERAGADLFRVRISVTGRQGPPVGERVLELNAIECRKLDGAIALVIATTLDPDLGARLPAELSWLRPSETPAGEQLRAELAHAPPTATNQALRSQRRRTRSRKPPRSRRPRRPRAT